MKATQLRSFFMQYLIPLAVLAILPLIGWLLESTTNQYTQLICLYIFINSILALSLNLVNGFTGQFSIGHAGFMAVGAYTSAYLCREIPLWNAKMGWDLLADPNMRIAFSSLISGSLAAAAGWLVGLPSLRLRGDYLAIVTLGFSEIIRVIFLNLETIGGARGFYAITGTETAQIAGFEASPFMMNFLYAGIWTVVTYVVHWRLVHSTHGRCFLSVREDELASEIMGVNTTKTKVRAFVISSFFAGIAGAIFAHTTRYLNPATFTFSKSVDVIIMVVLGGMGSLSGSIIAAIIVTVLPELILRPLQEFTKIDLRMAIYSLTLILFMVLRPKGIFGTKEIGEFIKDLKLKKFKPVKSHE